MTPLSKRQEMAVALSEWLRARGAWCTSPLPLRDGTPLRVDIVADDAERLHRELVQRGYAVSQCGIGQRFSYEGPIPTVTLEVRLPPDRPTVSTKQVA
jgi:hypothetical protein